MADDVYGGAENKSFLRGNKYGTQRHSHTQPTMKESGYMRLHVTSTTGWGRGPHVYTLINCTIIFFFSSYQLNTPGYWY